MPEKHFFQSSFHWGHNNIFAKRYFTHGLSILFSLRNSTNVRWITHIKSYFQSSFHWVPSFVRSQGESSLVIRFQSSFHWELDGNLAKIVDNVIFQSSFHWDCTRVAEAAYRLYKLSILFSLRVRGLQGYWWRVIWLSILFSLSYIELDPNKPPTGTVFQSSFHWDSLGNIQKTIQLYAFQSSFHWGSPIIQQGRLLKQNAFNPLFIELPIRRISPTPYITAFNPLFIETEIIIRAERRKGVILSILFSLSTGGNRNSA